MTPNNPPLGAELRARREARGLNRTELAAHLGTTAVAVSAWEDNGQQPSDEHAAALVELFGESERSA
jgi:transcriptional regulator with XRE-family HTH domain